MTFLALWTPLNWCLEKNGPFQVHSRRASKPRCWCGLERGTVTVPGFPRWCTHVCVNRGRRVVKMIQAGAAVVGTACAWISPKADNYSAVLVASLTVWGVGVTAAEAKQLKFISSCSFCFTQRFENQHLKLNFCLPDDIKTPPTPCWCSLSLLALRSGPNFLP